jgi:hypothetical protein
MYISIYVCIYVYTYTLFIHTHKHTWMHIPQPPASNCCLSKATVKSMPWSCCLYINMCVCVCVSKSGFCSSAHPYTYTHKHKYIPQEESHCHPAGPSHKHHRLGSCHNRWTVGMCVCVCVCECVFCSS